MSDAGPPPRMRKPGAGRKPKADALTPAERSARYRQRQRERLKALERAAMIPPVHGRGIGQLYDVDATLLQKAIDEQDPDLLVLAANSVLDGHRKAKD